MAQETFAERLKRLSAKAGLKEADIASASGMSATTAGRLLDGTTKSIKLDEALKLCRRLGVTPWELGGEREPRAADKSPSVEPDLLQELEGRVDALSELPDLVQRLSAELRDLSNDVQSMHTLLQSRSNS